MSLIPAPIANFLSTYGPPLNKIFNTNAKIPLVCAVDPTGVALGGAGTVGNTEFLTNFATAAGTSGQDAARAFDLSGPIPLMCMVNPDGTPYESYSSPYQELRFNWTQASTDAPVVTRVNINTIASAPVISPGRVAAGTFSFTFNQPIFSVSREYVDISVSAPFVSTLGQLAWQIIGPNTLYVYSVDNPVTLTYADEVGSSSNNATISIKIYP